MGTHRVFQGLCSLVLALLLAQERGMFCFLEGQTGIRVTFSFPVAPRTGGIHVSLPPCLWQMEMEFWSQ